jgi:hypothetical protein
MNNQSNFRRIGADNTARRPDKRYADIYPMRSEETEKTRANWKVIVKEFENDQPADRRKWTL